MLRCSPGLVRASLEARRAAALPALLDHPSRLDAQGRVEHLRMTWSYAIAPRFRGGRPRTRSRLGRRWRARLGRRRAAPTPPTRQCRRRASPCPSARSRRR
jgi:hypothetical protein